MLTKESRPPWEEEDNSTDNYSPPNTTLQPFNLEWLKELWNGGDFEEVDCKEIALFAAYEDRGGSPGKAEINNYGGMTYSIADFDAIKSIRKKILDLKVKNTDTKVQQIEHVGKSTKHAADVWKKQLSSEKWE